MKKSIVLAGMCACLLIALPGCKGKPTSQPTVRSYAQGVRMAIRGVLWEIPRKNNRDYDMRTAADQLTRALAGLPKTVADSAADRNQQRQAAERAVQFFAQLRPTLESRQYDPAEMIARMNELSKLIDEVEK